MTPLCEHLRALLGKVPWPARSRFPRPRKPAPRGFRAITAFSTPKQCKERSTNSTPDRTPS